MKTGFTTTILHSDLESPIEHFSVHKPMHVAAAYGYPDAHDLARVFKGEMPGYSYGRQGNPTATALESKVTNILMRPNDQYLCIVAARPPGGEKRIFLPFDDDPTLTLILSKAFMLANDDVIKDASILRQIKQQ